MVTYAEERTVKLHTIWTMPAMSLTERMRRTHECALRSIAHRLPRRLAYWSFIDSGARLVADDIVPESRYMEMLGRADSWA